MIELNTSAGQQIFLSPSAIAQIREAGTSSQWHGIRAFIKTFDGQTIEVTETAPEVAKRVREDVAAAAEIARATAQKG